MKKLLTILAAVVGVVVIAGGLAYYIAFGGSGKKTHQPPPPPVLMDGGSYTTNLSNDNQENFIKVSLTLVLSDKQAAEDLKKQNAAMQNAILYCLRSETYQDVAGASGMNRLAKKIEARLDPLVAPGRVVRVYFTQFVDQ